MHPDDTPARQGWRYLDPQQRFMVLLNHYGSAKALASASGLSDRSLRAIYTATELQGKNSPKLSTAEFREGFRRARHRMTDALRRRVQKAGTYEAPIFRTPVNVLQPEQYQYQYSEIDRSGRLIEVTSKSKWYSYNVEFMTDDEIYSLIYQLFDTFMATGQFNLARFVYWADADIYPGEGGFKNKDYRRDAEKNKVISMGSIPFSFAEADTPAEFAGKVMDEWGVLQLKGAIRMRAIYVTSMADIERGEPLRLARAGYKKWVKGGKRDKSDGKRGRGRGV